MAVNVKNKAIQQAMQVENEVKVAEAQAKKLIVAAEAEKKANECEDYTHVFSLRGDSIVTRGLLKVKNLLCKRV